MFSPYKRSRRQQLLPIPVIMLVLSQGGSSPVAQTIASGKQATTVPVSVAKATTIVTESYVDYLKAFELGESGSQLAALRLLAESLRLHAGNLPPHLSHAH